MSDPRLKLAQTLRTRADEIKNFQVVAGFDGFVDQFIRVVDERQGLDRYKAVQSIEKFSGMLAAAAGRSSLREIVVTEEAAGGCAVNLGDGLLGFGLQLDYFGTVGIPIHKAFEDFSRKCRTFTGWACEPGSTLAFEFQDGKYMLSSVSHLADFSPEAIRKALSDGAFLAACEKAQALTFTNWTLYPHMTECWKLLQQEVISKLPNNPWIFIDLVDPRSRSRSDIKSMLDVLPEFENGGRLVFGGNLNEANVLADIMGLPTVEKEEGAAVAEQAAAIREKLGVSEVATHCIGCAAVSTQIGSYHFKGPYTPTPKRSTGAGDRYNAGYVLGLLLDLDAQERIILGNATSGYFVRNEKSGNAHQVADLLEAWAGGVLPD